MPSQDGGGLTALSHSETPGVKSGSYWHGAAVVAGVFLLRGSVVRVHFKQIRK